MDSKSQIISAEAAQAYTAPGPHRRGDSIEIDPVARRITKINGLAVPPELHTDQMQSHVEAELGEQQYARVDDKIVAVEAAKTEHAIAEGSEA